MRKEGATEHTKVKETGLEVCLVGVELLCTI
jgi:hypothetical protein